MAYDSSSPYYVAAVAACRDVDGQVMVRLHAMVLHPDVGVDPEQLALDTARLDALPTAEGWYDHHAVIEPLAEVIRMMIEAEKDAQPPEIRVVKYRTVSGGFDGR